jgi:hypothetical protein
MTRSGQGDEPDSTGFAFTRRRLLKTGAVGVAAATAGCGEQDVVDLNPSSTPDSTPTQAEPEDERVPETGLVDDGLTVVSSSLVEDPRRTELQSQLDRQIETERYIRVLVRNDLDQPIGVVTISVDLFDDSRRFLEVQLATISSLRSGELFEGYVPFFNRDAALYVIRARRSQRRGDTQDLPAVSLTDHCLDDEQVHGTVRNEGASAVGRLRVQVRFRGGNGNSLGTASTLVSDLGSGESRDFTVDSDALLDERTADVTDYSIEVGKYGGGPLAIR